VISKKCAQEVEIETWRTKGSVGYSGGTTSAVVECTWIPEIRIGSARFLDVPATMDDLSAFGMDGILGFPLFADLVLTIDGPGNRLRLSEEQIPSSNSTQYELPLKEDATCPEVGGLVAGHKALFKIDSGFDGTLYLPRSAGEGLDIEPASPPEQEVRTVMGIRTVKVGTLRDPVVLGGLTLDDVPVMIGMGRVLLGGGFLRQHVVSFDQRSRLVRLNAGN